jgi:hypothetical protein
MNIEALNDRLTRGYRQVGSLERTVAELQSAVTGARPPCQLRKENPTSDTMRPHAPMWAGERAGVRVVPAGVGERVRTAHVEQLGALRQRVRPLHQKRN